MAKLTKSCLSWHGELLQDLSAIGNIHPCLLNFVVFRLLGLWASLESFVLGHWIERCEPNTGIMRTHRFTKGKCKDGNIYNIYESMNISLYKPALILILRVCGATCLVQGNRADRSLSHEICFTTDLSVLTSSQTSFLRSYLLHQEPLDNKLSTTATSGTKPPFTPNTFCTSHWHNRHKEILCNNDLLHHNTICLWNLLHQPTPFTPET